MSTRPMEAREAWVEWGELLAHRGTAVPRLQDPWLIARAISVVEPVCSNLVWWVCTKGRADADVGKHLPQGLLNKLRGPRRLDEPHHLDCREDS